MELMLFGDITMIYCACFITCGFVGEVYTVTTLPSSVCASPAFCTAESYWLLNSAVLSLEDILLCSWQRRNDA